MSISIQTLPLGELQANAYLISNEKNELLIIDPGDDVPALVNAIEENHFLPRAVVLTHGHFDHMLGAAHIKNRYGAKVYISRDDEIFLSDAHYNLYPDYAVTEFLPIRADRLLPEGAWDILGARFTVLPTPGHTPGGVCLYHEETGSLFSGDTLFSNGFGRTDFPGGDMGKLFQSVKSLFKLPPETMVYPGHGTQARMGDIRKGFYR